MNFRLQDIEFHIDDSILESAEQLLANGEILALRAVDKNLYATKVDADAAVEVEVQLTGNRVKACTCECSIFQETGICTHIGAVLLQLRADKKEEYQRKEKARQLKNERKPSKFNVPYILQEITEQELKDFIRKYSKHDRKFTLAFKARFAGKVELADNHDKYQQLISAAFKFERNLKGVFKAGGLRRVLAIIEDVFFHAETAFNEEDYFECFAAQRAVFEQVPLLLIYGRDFDIILEGIEAGFSIFHRLLKRDQTLLAPELEEQLWQFCLYTAFYPSLLAHPYLVHFKPLLHKSLSNPKQLRLLLEQIEHAQENKLLSISNRDFLALWALELKENLGDQAGIEASFSEIIEQPRTLEYVIDQSRKAGKLARARLLTEQALLVHHKGSFHRLLMQELVLLAQSQKDLKTTRQLSKQQFLITYDFLFYDILKESSKKGWAKVLKQILKEIEGLKSVELKSHLLAEIYYREGEIDQLLVHLKEADSLKLLMKYDQFLMKAHKKALLGLYQDLTSNYLDQHLGRPAALKARSIIQHLFQIEAPDLARKMITLLRKRYLARKSMMEELEIF